MMGPAFYVMAILGCGEADAACEPVADLAARYVSEAECNAAVDEAIMRHGDAPYPVLVAQCRSAEDRVAAKLWADEIRLPDAQQRPRIRSASRQPRRVRS